MLFIQYELMLDQKIDYGKIVFIKKMDEVCKTVFLYLLWFRIFAYCPRRKKHY